MSRSGCSRSAVVMVGVLALTVVVGCGSDSHRAAGSRPAGTSSTAAATPPDTGTQPPSTAAAATTVPSTSPPSPATTGASANPPAAGPAGPGSLAGKMIAIDPGHNGGNFTDPSFINHPIFNGRTSEACDTTGTETDAGYTEAQFNFDVSMDLAADLRAEGATVVLTRTTNTGVGPCVPDRAAIGNAAHANAAISIHADGGPPGGRGFAVLLPVADGPNNAIVASSATLGLVIRGDFAGATGMPVSTYDGVGGLQPRDDLGGLNLSTVPKVLIECGNMRNATDSALLISPEWQQRAATALARGLAAFVTQT